MSKNQLNYTNLSSKELELLKDTYIDLKVKSMNHNDLKNFATDNISLQIKNTIGNEEELEAWQEMEEFFNDNFLNIINEIKSKINLTKSDQIDSKIEHIKISTEANKEDKKSDMWED